jgi:hypothetical protein
LETLPSVHGEPAYSVGDAARRIDLLTSEKLPNAVLRSFTIRIRKFVPEEALAILLSMGGINGFSGRRCGRMVDYDVLYFRNEWSS